MIRGLNFIKKCFFSSAQAAQDAVRASSIEGHEDWNLVFHSGESSGAG